jgi:glycosyltransferase involved in cell wall biosynthesis
MKALFVTNHVPSNASESTTGTFKRMRTFIDALQQKASLRLLCYCRVDHGTVSHRAAETRALLQSQWQLGEDVEVIICPEDPDPEYGDRLWRGYFARALSFHRQVGYACTSGDRQLHAFERCLEDEPDLVFAHRLHTMCPLILTKRQLPPVFLDLDDVEHKTFLRNISQPPTWRAKQLYYLQLPALLWGERRAIKLSRKTFVCSELDKHYLNRMLRLSNVDVIPNSIHIPEVQALQERPVLLFLGTYTYKANANAAEELVTQIWPLVRKACPNARLVIAGDKPERIRTFGQAQAGVEYAGFVHDLDSLYGDARVVCCPIRSGGGTRIKIIEAAAYAKPVVSTSMGAEGLQFDDGREILLRDDVQEFADACIRLLNDDASCMSIGRAAHAKAVSVYDRRNVIRRIQSEILGAIA